MTDVRTLDPARYSCALHRFHSPLPLVLHAHHVVPLTYTQTHGLPDSRTVPLCPTGHGNVHVLIRDWQTGRRTNWARVDERVRPLVAEALTAMAAS